MVRLRCDILLYNKSFADELITRSVTVWVVGDLETSEGRELYYNAIKHLVCDENNLPLTAKIIL
jgi:hypothetical protein